MSRTTDEKEVDPTVPERTREGRRRWEESAREAFVRRPPWKRDFTTVSGAPVEPLAAPDTLNLSTGYVLEKLRAHSQAPSARSLRGGNS